MVKTGSDGYYDDEFEGMDFEDLEHEDLVEIAYSMQHENSMLVDEMMFLKEIIAHKMDLIQYKNRTIRSIKFDLDALSDQLAQNEQDQPELDRLKESHEIVKKFLKSHNLSADFEEFITSSIYDKKTKKKRKPKTNKQDDTDQ